MPGNFNPTAKQRANLKRNKKGSPSFNPEGARAHDPVKKALKKLTGDAVAEAVSLIVDGDLKKIEKLAKNKNEKVLNVWLASIAEKAVRRGDPHALNVILDRAIGRVKEGSDADPGRSSLEIEIE